MSVLFVFNGMCHVFLCNIKWFLMVQKQDAPALPPTGTRVLTSAPESQRCDRVVHLHKSDLLNHHITKLKHSFQLGLITHHLMPSL